MKECNNNDDDDDHDDGIFLLGPEDGSPGRSACTEARPLVSRYVKS